MITLNFNIPTRFITQDASVGENDVEYHINVVRYRWMVLVQLMRSRNVNQKKRMIAISLEDAIDKTGICAQLSYRNNLQACMTWKLTFDPDILRKEASNHVEIYDWGAILSA